MPHRENVFANFGQNKKRVLSERISIFYWAPHVVKNFPIEISPSNGSDF
jgi:hypothetical protein